MFTTPIATVVYPKNDPVKNHQLALLVEDTEEWAKLAEDVDHELYLNGVSKSFDERLQRGVRGWALEEVSGVSADSILLNMSTNKFKKEGLDLPVFYNGKEVTASRRVQPGDRVRGIFDFKVFMRRKKKHSRKASKVATVQLRGIEIVTPDLPETPPMLNNKTTTEACTYVMG